MVSSLNIGQEKETLGDSKIRRKFNLIEFFRLIIIRYPSQKWRARASSPDYLWSLNVCEYYIYVKQSQTILKSQWYLFQIVSHSDIF